MQHRTDVGLSDVLTSAAAALGDGRHEDRLGLGKCAIAVVCLIDGLGAASIEEHPEVFDWLERAEGGSIEAAFPTTTATGVATLGTGLHPGQHGVVGASFWLPEHDQVLSPLQWGHHPLPRAVQPEPTVFETLESTDIRSVTIAPAAYARSGLTAAALRGSDYRAAEDSEDRAARLASVVREGRPSLVYVYWPALDKAAHEYGPGSDRWLEAAVEVRDLLTALNDELPADGLMVVTADHGMVDTTARVWIEDHPELQVGVRLVTGEPRMRHVYTWPENTGGVGVGEPADVARRWQDVLGDEALVLLRDEAIARGLFGSVDPALAERIGDVVALSTGTTIIASHRADERVSMLRGQHGALTDRERRIPALVLRGG